MGVQVLRTSQPVRFANALRSVFFLLLMATVSTGCGGGSSDSSDPAVPVKGLGVTPLDCISETLCSTSADCEPGYLCNQSYSVFRCQRAYCEKSFLFATQRSKMPLPEWSCV